jgi:hypothetical protein
VEIALDRAACLATFQKQGGAAMCAALGTLFYLVTGQDLDLYSMSADWTYINTVKIIRCRGNKGGLIVHLT